MARETLLSAGPMPEISLMDRALGAYLGLAIGDALGATVEFMTETEIKAEFGVHRSIVGGGWLRLKAGQVTDDTQMSIALGNALVATGGWDLRAVAEAFAAWLRSIPVDVGSTCRRGIRRYMLEGTLAVTPSEDQAGNGGAMRNLPVVLSTFGDDAALVERSLAQAHLTHWHPLADAGTVALGRLTHILLRGGSLGECREVLDRLVAEHPKFRFEPWPGKTSGFIVDTLQTVFYPLFRTDSFEDYLVSVVNRGGDADTTGALAGQLGGALYGAQAIPQKWLKRLDPAVLAIVKDQAPRLLALSPGNRAGAAVAEPPGQEARLPWPPSFGRLATPRP